MGVWKPDFNWVTDFGSFISSFSLYLMTILRSYIKHSRVFYQVTKHLVNYIKQNGQQIYYLLTIVFWYMYMICWPLCLIYYLLAIVFDILSVGYVPPC